MLSPKELMQPRYRVIGRYPDSPYQVGDILVPMKENPQHWLIESTGRTKQPIQTEVVEVHLDILFDRLLWWEYRNEEDMPKYVKINRYPKARDVVAFPVCFKVVKPYPISHPDFSACGANTIHIENGSIYEGESFPSEDGSGNMVTMAEIRFFIPATEDEYLKQQELISIHKKASL